MLSLQQYSSECFGINVQNTHYSQRASGWEYHNVKHIGAWQSSNAFIIDQEYFHSEWISLIVKVY